MVGAQARGIGEAGKGTAVVYGAGLPLRTLRGGDRTTATRSFTTWTTARTEQALFDTHVTSWNAFDFERG